MRLIPTPGVFVENRNDGVRLELQGRKVEFEFEDLERRLDDDRPAYRRHREQHPLGREGERRHLDAVLGLLGSKDWLREGHRYRRSGWDQLGLDHRVQPVGLRLLRGKWNGSSFVRDASDGAGLRIAVGQFSNYTSESVLVPWVVTASGSIWRRRSADPASTTGWEQLGGLGKDIAVCGSGVNFAWVIGLDDRLWMWREQPGLGSGSSATTAVKGWFSIGAKTSATRAVACAGDANRVWAVSSDGTTTRNKR
jgi:hypothetical protein